ncbi:MAG TPA: SH3 domain-containing protein [Pyrinomonadaceae bacterium]|nr:SH3 domain-containing protein [Pyrinomonadaceae bacterium]
MPVKLKSGRAAAGTSGRLLFAAAALLFAFTFTARARQAAGARQRITTASNVRVRSSPDTTAEEVARLQLGTVVEELERSQEKAKVGASEDFWYMVSAPGGARGWVFGALTAPFDAARREEIYTRLASERAGKTDATFADASELVRFAERAAKEVSGRGARAELEFARLRALARSLTFLTAGEQSEGPYKQWAAEHESEIAYSEPSGEWYVRADLLWDLQAKYKDLAMAERIAWEAAQTPLPGECEGDVTCNMYYLSVTNGRYVKLYPRGAHAAEALKGLEEMVNAVVADSRSANRVYEVPPGSDAEFKKLLATLRSQLTPAATPAAARVLKQLNVIARLSSRRR